jgi:hypothetical protein
MALVTLPNDNMPRMPGLVSTSQLPFSTTVHLLNLPNAARTGSYRLTGVSV